MNEMLCLRQNCYFLRSVYVFPPVLSNVLWRLVPALDP